MPSLSHTKWNCKYHIVFMPKYFGFVIVNWFVSELKKYMK